MTNTPTEGAERRARKPGKYLVAGRVVRPHGVRGELLVSGASELMGGLTPDTSVYVGDDRATVQILSVRPHKKHYLVRLEGVSDRDEAEELRAAEICILASDAPPLTPGSYYQWQILGLSVVSDEGEFLGRVERIIETGANDVYVVSGDTGAELLIPAISSVVRTVDLESQTITVTLIDGLRDSQR